MIAWPTVPARRAAAGGAAGRAALRAPTPPTRRTSARRRPRQPDRRSPAISVPVGLDADGLPIALQLQAAWGRDELLLDAAEALERANGRRWVEPLPPLAERPSAPEA